MRIKYFQIIVFALLLVVLNSCYSYRQVGLLQEREDLPQYDSIAYEPYRLQVNDEIVYRVITMDQTIAKTLSTNNTSTGQYANSYRIYSDGTVDLPFLPPIKLAGLTELEARDTLRAAMREIIPDADVKLSMYNKRFTVLGDANSGTYYIYKERMTIFQALALSGDLRNAGDRRHVRIIRPHGNEEPEVLEFDIRTNTIIDSKYYYVYPNDLIYVSRDPASFYKQTSYSGFLALITSSVSLLITVLNYIPGLW
ncbi:MAG: polysaccharide biosynthesis/export family protein [Paludibacteraceae bacterium]|nr:polysaccharide biosynthesis/export family protein [Paludibacteraceae bacterium]